MKAFREHRTCVVANWKAHGTVSRSKNEHCLNVLSCCQNTCVLMGYVFVSVPIASPNIFILWAELNTSWTFILNEPVLTSYVLDIKKGSRGEACQILRSQCAYEKAKRDIAKLLLIRYSVVMLSLFCVLAPRNNWRRDEVAYFCKRALQPERVLSASSCVISRCAGQFRTYISLFVRLADMLTNGHGKKVLFCLSK